MTQLTDQRTSAQLLDTQVITGPSIETSPLILHEGAPLPPANRLVVLVPEGAIDLNDLAARIGRLAGEDRCEVFLLIAPASPDDKFSARESVSTLAATIRSEELPVQIRVDSGGNYLKALKPILRPGDLLVCYAEMAPGEVVQNQPFIDVLASATHLPVVALPGALPHPKTHISPRIQEALMVLACLATIIAFFGFQVWLDHALAGTVKTVLEVLSVLLEIRLIWAVADRHF